MADDPRFGKAALSLRYVLETARRILANVPMDELGGYSVMTEIGRHLELALELMPEEA